MGVWAVHAASSFKVEICGMRNLLGCMKIVTEVVTHIHVGRRERR
jgi:hypothetical protein